MLALGIDATHQLGKMEMAVMRDHPKLVPEDIFKADAGLVAADDERSFDHARLEMAVARFVRDLIDGALCAIGMQPIRA